MFHVRRALVALVTATLATGALALAPPIGAAGASTGYVRLFSTSPNAVLTVHNPGPDQWYEFEPSIYLKAIGARFEIDVRRPSYYRTLRAVVSTGGTPRTIPQTMLDGWSGIKNGFVITWRTQAGERISQDKMTWCPNSGQSSPLSPSDSEKTAFGFACGPNAFTRSQRWGVDKGWARQLLDYAITPPDLAKLGDHAKLDVAMRKDLANILGIPENDRTLHFDVTVKQETDNNGQPPAVARQSTGSPDTITSASSSNRRIVPRVVASTSVPPSSTLPDLIPLPAFGMSTHSESSADFLDFAATVYNAGPGPLVAEGYRRGSQPVMDAYQRFYRGTRLVATRQVGTMEYDARLSHRHWHFKDFAVYDLIDSTGHRVRTSGKEAFCVAPTDGVDLLRPGAAVDPGNGDLSTACGWESSIWVREVLAAGWGDTYTQQRAGQSINISSLPNGTYWVRVTANPAHRLIEKSTANNVALRRIVIGGTPGARRVWVPNLGRVDSETPYFAQDGPGAPLQ